MPTKDYLLYNWKIGGEAGYGIMNIAGPIFAKTLLRAGFFIFIYSEYPSLIRGGHNTMQAAVSSKPVSGVYSQIDQLVALNAHTIAMHQYEVKKGGVVIYDADDVKVKSEKLKGKSTSQKLKVLANNRIPPLTGTYTVKAAMQKVKLRSDIKFIPINFTKIAEDVGGDKIMKNVAAVGASLKQFKVDEDDLLEIAKEVIAGVFKSKGQKIIKANRQVMEAGYNSISKSRVH